MFSRPGCLPCLLWATALPPGLQTRGAGESSLRGGRAGLEPESPAWTSPRRTESLPSLRGSKPPPPPEGWEGALPRAEKSGLTGPEPRPLLNKALFISGSYSPTVFTSWGRRSNLPQTGWLETTEMYLLAVLEARNPGSRCPQGLTLGEAGGSKASCFPPSPTFRRHPFAGPGLAHSSLPRLHRAVLTLRCVCLPLLSPQHATHCTQARPPSTVI